MCVSLLHTIEAVHTCAMDRMSGMQVPLSDTVWSKFSKLWSLLTEKQERGLIQRRGISLPPYCLLLYSPVFKCLLILTYTIFKLVTQHLWVLYLLCWLFGCVLGWSYLTSFRLHLLQHVRVVIRLFVLGNRQLSIIVPVISIWLATPIQY